MGIIGYARVSTQGQELDLQLDALRAAGCERIFEDRGVSGAKAARPGLDDLVRYVREGDVLTVYKLDRLGRNVSHLLAFVEELSKRKVGFRSLTEQLDTTTPGGRLLFHLFASLSQFERDLIVERTQAGLTAAAARGRKGGRPRSVTPEKLARAKELMADRKLTTPEIARRLKVSKSALYDALAESKSASSSDAPLPIAAK
jgi:DNA invertase Pin-like site-specific DNA recombinase